MFIGHFGVALGAKRIAPRASLGTLVMAAQFLDLIWPVFLLLGLERVVIAPGNTAVTPLDFISYPLSHSLLAAVGWAFLFAGIYRIVKGHVREAVVLWFLVVSHWLLDAWSHQPDLPLYPGSSTYVGLGLWNSHFWTVFVEGAIFAFGARLYARGTRPRGLLGTLALQSFIGVLLFFYLIDIFGPPPPSPGAVAWGSLTLWIFVFWAYWVDRQRTVRPPETLTVGPMEPPTVGFTEPPGNRFG